MTLSDPPSIEDDVIEVLKRMSRQPIEPSPSSDLVIDLGFDSLQILEVIAALEDRFDVSIPLNDVPSTRTVAQVVAQVTAPVEVERPSNARRSAHLPARSPRLPAATPATSSWLLAGRRAVRTRTSTRPPSVWRPPSAPWDWSVVTWWRSSSATPSSF